MKLNRPDYAKHPHLLHSLLMSRRAFLRTTGLLGGATTLSALAAACAGPEATEAPLAAPETMTTEEGPRYGGVYRLVGPGDFRTLDPPGAESSEDWWSAGMVLYNQLYFYDREGTSIPIWLPRCPLSAMTAPSIPSPFARAFFFTMGAS